ncbi:MAG: hypothetical protein HAW59_06535 [Betaproteobacteria bacterium]|nr:hypothetical protein [Betaproteobacteria bacterium]
MKNDDAADFPAPTYDKDADFPARDSYVDQRIRNGDRRNCVYPPNSIPKQKEGERKEMPPLLSVLGKDINCS